MSLIFFQEVGTRNKLNFIEVGNQQDNFKLFYEILIYMSAL